MKQNHLSYFSNNGIRFHHTTSFATETYTDTVAPELHTWCELLLLLSGHVSYYIDSIEYRLSPMDVIILAPNTLHSIAMDTKQPYERMVLHFAPDLLPKLQELDLLAPFYNAASFAYILPASIVQSYGLDKQILKIKDICKDTSVYQNVYMIQNIISITETIHRLTDAYSNIETIISKNPVSNKQKILQQCTEYINKNISSDISAHDIAQHVHLSVSYIQHLFKEKNGITLSKYILHQKMKKAYHLLSQGQPPQIVAEQLGYQYYTTFYHHFKRIIHLSPSDVFKTQVNRLFTDKSFNDIN